MTSNKNRQKLFFFFSEVLMITILFSGCNFQSIHQDVVKSNNEKQILQSEGENDNQEDVDDLHFLEQNIEVGHMSNDVTTLTNKDNSQRVANMQQTINQLPIDMKLARSCKGAILNTDYGKIELEFYNEKTPITIANFCTLAKKGFYSKLIFHRVIRDFIIQSGKAKGVNADDIKYNIPDEISKDNYNKKYTIAMANVGPNTNSSQFFINTRDNDFLNNKHTVFGEVINGKEVVDEIESVAVDKNDKPLKKVIIKNIEIITNSK